MMNEEGGTESFYRRRKSSNFEMLSDPFKYQDMVKQYLDEVEEEEGKMRDGSKSNRVSARKRTRSSNYFKCPPIPNKLADINEEYEDHANQYQLAEQDPRHFIKKSIQNYSFGTPS